MFSRPQKKNCTTSNLDSPGVETRLRLRYICHAPGSSKTASYRRFVAVCELHSPESPDRSRSPNREKLNWAIRFPNQNQVDSRCWSEWRFCDESVCRANLSGITNDLAQLSIGIKQVVCPCERRTARVCVCVCVCERERERERERESE